MTDKREFSRFANDVARDALNELLVSEGSPDRYRASMEVLGRCLGEALNQVLPDHEKCLIASTAEDADYLSYGLLQELDRKHETLAAVFWNNHYSLEKGSIAPVVHKYLQPGYDKADSLVVVKSVISGSCVVRTNILALIEQIKVRKIYIVSPVMHAKAKSALESEFPREVSDKFEFICFAIDALRDPSSGEVLPGIGGQVYQLLGIGDQPVRTSYIPKMVMKLVAG